MNSVPTFRIVAAGAFALGFAATAVAQSSRTPAPIEDLDPGSGIFVRLGGFVRSGVKVEFHDSAPILPTGAGLYDNGFVVPSISGPGAAQTWNWGYNGTRHDGSPQVQEGQLTLERLSNPARVGDLNGGDKSLFGGEVFAGFEVIRFHVRNQEVRFGFEAGIGYSTVSGRAQASATTANATLQADSFQLARDGAGNFIVPPQGPYAGTFAGPGPLISLAPVGSTTTAATAGSSAFAGKLDADLYTLKIGPYFDLPLGRHFHAVASFGYAVVLADAEFTFTETTSYAGGAIPGVNLTPAPFRRSQWQPGAYLELRAKYEFNDHIGVFIGAGAQMNENLRFGALGREAEIKFSTTYGATLGVEYHF